MGCGNSVHTKVAADREPSTHVAVSRSCELEDHEDPELAKAGWAWPKRPPYPSMACTKVQLFEYLQTYVMIPPAIMNTALVAADQEAEQEAPESPTAQRTATPPPATSHLAVPKSDTPIRRKSVSAAVESADISNKQLRRISKSAESKAALVAALGKVPIFAHLEEDELDRVADAMDVKSFPDVGTKVVASGDSITEASEMYVASRGTFSMTPGLHGEASTILFPGDTFGVQDVMILMGGNSTRNFTVETLEPDAELYALDAPSFRTVNARNRYLKTELYTSLLSKVSYLSSMSTASKQMLCDMLQPSKYVQIGQPIIEYNSEPEWMHIIVSGSVDVVGRDDDGKSKVVCSFARGDVVGELEFLNNHKTVADVVVKEAPVKTVRLSRKHFERTMGPVVDLLKERASGQQFTYYHDQLKRLKETVSVD